MVTISGREHGYEIRYTLDGTEPTENSRLYNGPFKLSRSATVKSIGYAPEGHATQILEGRFIRQTPIQGIHLNTVRPGLQYDYYVLDDVLQSTRELYDLEIDNSAIVDSISYPDIDLPLRFGLIYRGYIKVAQPGIYTFYTISNDGSMLYIHDQLVVDNDGPHGARERFGQIALKPGYHPIKLEYKQIGGSRALEVYIKGPGSEKRQIRSEELAHLDKCVKQSFLKNEQTF
jgi:hexosaminidase